MHCWERLPGLERWIEKHRSHLLPCGYFLVTFTLRAELRPLARSHPRKIYGLLMKAAADALQKLAIDPRNLGTRIVALAVLHTWTRAMLLHPHVHMLVTAGGLSPDGLWIDSEHPRFLVPVEALSVILRAKSCVGLKKRVYSATRQPQSGRKNGSFTLNTRAVVKRSSTIWAATYSESLSQTAG